MRRTGSVLFFAALSLAVHLAWVLWMPVGQPTTQSDANWVEMTFESPAPAVPEALALNEAAPEPPAEVVPPQPTAAVEPRPVPRVDRHAHSKAQMELPPPTEAQPAPVQPAEPPQQLAAAEPAAPRPVPPRPVDLSPRSAALSVEEFTQGNALRCAGRATPGQNDCAPTQAETGQAAQAALTRDLNAVAHSVSHLRTREHPVLSRRSDGSYAYDGHVFQAVVQPDGKVEFSDAAAKAQLRPSLVPVVITADLNDLVEHSVLGGELYSAEKQWLLDETRELRDKLATEYRRRELQDANRELERTLRSVLDDSALTLAKKHDAVFVLWEHCGDDAQAQAHRRAVENFVKRYMPQGSALGFVADELERFNAARAGLRRFQPYSGS